MQLAHVGGRGAASPRPSQLLLIPICAAFLLVPARGWAIPEAEDPWAGLKAAMRAAGVDPDSVEIPGSLTGEMKQWARSLVAPGSPPDRTVRMLLAALIDPRGFQLVYDPSFTATAREAFSTRRANCLAFTHLFVGMSRELGVPTYYVRWELVEKVRREGDLVVVSGHVSAGYGAANDRRVLEFGAVSGLEVKSARPISDINAVARHYANRSAEHLREGELQEAVAAAELAVRLDPTLPDGWVNLGVSRRRSNDLEGAEEAYRYATRVDPDHLPAYHNLSVLLELRGEADTAREILGLLDRRDNRNPFIYLTLGDERLDADQLTEAGRFYRRALRLGPKLAETRAAWGRWELRRGNLERAKKWLRRAQQADPDESRTVELARELSGQTQPDE